MPAQFLFLSQATEIEKARAVARKALKTISFREEQEKLNVWVALLNLENLYGTSESLEKTLQEAVQASDASKVYTQMLKIFADTNKVEVGLVVDCPWICVTTLLVYRRELLSLKQCCANSEQTWRLGCKAEISTSSPTNWKKEGICCNEL